MRSAAIATSLFVCISAQAADAVGNDAPYAFSDTWHFNLGMGVMSVPKYPGASDRKFQVAPIGGATYGRFFFGASDASPTVPFGAGMYFYRDQHWQAGVVLSYDLFSPRDESDDETRLHGLGDVKKTAHAALFGRYSRDWYAFSASVATDIAGKHEGTQIRLGAEAKFPVTRQLMLTAGPSIRWSSSTYNQTFYGVDAAQSVASGRAQYNPGAGISDINFSVGAMYRLTSKWTMGARIGESYLPTRVSDSPIVGKKTEFTGGIFAGYSF
ncbi:MipA/OmpV family protein [Paraburkholderia sp.]|uniref:MipA/OmpV family protein n=1 Tax=Paraburkholderia sp. TaxID=1926495 RepID=UPI00239E88D3|nr:MipA/OmpV family protein [Paraburkholderia sp.]MDE1182381.1 MipA/OmpV family protein [Paraburkholderia sp.]